MAEKEKMVEQLNRLILEFEESSNIENYAIIFTNRVVMAPNARNLTKEQVLDILTNLDIETLQKKFQKGDLHLMQLEFKGDSIFYVQSTSQVRIIALVEDRDCEEARKLLHNFALNIKEVLGSIAKSPQEDQSLIDVNRGLANLDELIAAFKVPNFEGFNKLVKYALSFKTDG
ncbi:MAG: hypothetical protein EU536_02380 [Promethearchaeota archaeon]|nr:MAG: hypothetical protein EU536_02380 [Candidatus Lokiarchaeota archaeon]